MKFFLEAILCAVLLNSPAPAKSGIDGRKPQCNVNNYFYAGSNTKKIEQQLDEIMQEIKALRENRTDGGGSGRKGI